MTDNRVYAALEELIALNALQTVTIMCAEKSPRDCHRKLLSDFLTARSIEVKHIVDKDTVTSHRLTPCLKITEDQKVIYPCPLFPNR